VRQEAGRCPALVAPDVRQRAYHFVTSQGHST